MKLFAVIMAGGVGARFWPRSREKKPKQLLKIFGKNTMIQDTVARLKGIVDDDKIFVITNKVQKLMIKDQIPHIPADNIIDEPFGKNTAACIGLASVIINKIDKDAVTMVLPADHLIKDVSKFQHTILSAAAFANRKKGLVTIGIKPTRPETGYGYIQVEENPTDDSVFKVLTFAEKPNLSTAMRFLESGDFLWNSGMFIWRVDAILNEIKTLLPDLHYGLEELAPTIGTPDFDKMLTQVYGQLKSISIDYGVMENSKNVFLVKGDFDWSDVGSWETVYELTNKDDDGNSIVGEGYAVKSYNSYVFSPNKFTAVIGVENVIVIDTEDSLLICHRNNAQDVKQVIDYLKMNNRHELL